MGTPKISVICVTKRYGFEEILSDDMNRQTFRDFEVIVADENYDGEYSIFDKQFKPKAKLPTDAWNLNKAYNEAISFSCGELLVFLQDFIWIPDNGLARFWEDYKTNSNALITGCGHKAKDWLDGISEEDHRLHAYPDGLSKCKNFYAEWEMNWACAPKAIMPRFEERMDEWYGGENQYVAKKAMLEGHDILIDRNNVCVGFSQDHCGGRPPDWEDRHCWREGRLQAFLKHLDLTYG